MIRAEDQQLQAAVRNRRDGRFEAAIESNLQSVQQEWYLCPVAGVREGGAKIGVQGVGYPEQDQQRREDRHRGSV